MVWYSKTNKCWFRDQEIKKILIPNVQILGWVAHDYISRLPFIHLKNKGDRSYSLWGPLYLRNFIDIFCTNLKVVCEIKICLWSYAQKLIWYKIQCIITL